ncbi:Uncharacterised protein [Enterobacter hormaechei]|uniref:phage tail tip fiber protein n=1 Tax=Enterobacter hormaechei TaxID=158836 RepID=UPI00079AF351|nr:DUF1983 domain-containing protein [Enterobacter hormaechei]SAE32521.1 Uncharacterised protein [Enterobacter hormaechei]VAF13041.1 Uncharacterised protein [Enterobacter hormaechei]
MKKTLSLKDAMRSLHVIETDEGIELQSAAGTAKYDAWGARREVNGIPEYFPSSVTVNKRQPAPVGDKAPSVTDESCAPLVRTMKLRVELDTSDAQKAIDDLVDEISNSHAFKVLKDGWSFEKNGMLVINNGQVFVTDAKIDDAMLSTNYSVKMNVAGKGKPHEAGMTLGVEDGQSKVEFMADRYTVHDAVQSIIGNAVVSATKTKIELGDEMKQAVIDAVRESDLFAALQASINAQAASVAGLQQAMHDAVNNAVNDAIRNALKPGGILWNASRRGF